MVSPYQRRRRAPRPRFVRGARWVSVWLSMTTPARHGLASAFPALAFALLACGSEPPPAGFEPLGGAGGSGGDGGAASASSSSNASTADSPSSTAEGTSSAGGAGGAGSTASATSSTSTGPTCDDTGPGEPNDTEQEAVDLGTIGDCDDQADTVSGVLTGFSDVDWYKYLGADASSFCTVDPGRALTSANAVTLCKFIQCADGSAPSFDCPTGTTAASSPEGRPGCCGQAGFELDLTCGSSAFNADDATIFLRIEPEVGLCTSYSLTYDF
jgi:hypothetical protein